MGTHEYDKNMKPDSEFIQGDLSFLVRGNKCRLLDGRRTAGFIEEYDWESGMFRWRITKFEDKGKHWDIPAEFISRFQFEKDSVKLEESRVHRIKEKIKRLDKELQIEAKESERIKTEGEIHATEKSIKNWLIESSRFFRNKGKLNLNSREGSTLLAEDLSDYMKSKGLYDLDKKTAENFVLNPNSGEWIKGMEIVLAEMGLVSYNGKAPRTKDIFSGLGSKDFRSNYIITRMAFIKAYFDLLNIHEIVLFRGMSSERPWKEVPRTFLSCTFNYDVAKDFSDFSKESKYITSYIIKTTIPVRKLFMTYLETAALNKQYKEAEALILYNEKISI